MRFIDLKGYPGFFADCNDGFPIPSGRGTRGAPSRSSPEPSLLRVESVGDFEASFVPSPADFGRLDPRFRLPSAAFEKLPQYRDYGFVVFQFKESAGTPHPMAFEFASRLTDRLFYPTVHIHDGRIHEKEHFDHALYLQDGGAHGTEPEGAAKNFVDIAGAQGIVKGDSPLRRVKRSGMLPNTDTLFDTTRRNPGRLGWVSAGLGAALLGGWLWQNKRTRR